MLAFIGHYGFLLVLAFGLYLSWLEHLKFDAEVKAGKWKRLDRGGLNGNRRNSGD